MSLSDFQSGLYNVKKNHSGFAGTTNLLNLRSSRVFSSVPPAILASQSFLLSSGSSRILSPTGARRVGDLTILSALIETCTKRLSRRGRC